MGSRSSRKRGGGSGDRSRRGNKSGSKSGKKNLADDDFNITNFFIL